MSINPVLNERSVKRGLRTEWGIGVRRGESPSTGTLKWRGNGEVSRMPSGFLAVNGEAFIL